MRPHWSGQSDIVVYDEATEENIKDAITNWARQKVEESLGPLYVVMTDHGSQGPPPALMLDRRALEAGELASWLDEFDNSLAPGSQTTLVPEIIIYGACYSGGFIPYLSKPGRIIIATAAENERSYRGSWQPGCINVREGEFFLGEFFKHISDGLTIRDSFRQATEATEEWTVSEGRNLDPNAISRFFDNASQHPLLEDNGDGEGSNLVSNFNAGDDSTDGLNSDFVVGEGTNAPGSVLAEIAEVSGERFLDAGNGLSFRDYEGHVAPEQYLWARVYDSFFVDEAFVEIKPPVSVPEGLKDTTVQLKRDVRELGSDAFDAATETYKWENYNRDGFDGFTEPGRYQIAYYLKDAETGNITTPLISWVYRDKEGNKPPRPFDLKWPRDGAKRVPRYPIFDWEDTIDPDMEPGDSPTTYTLIIRPVSGSPQAKEIIVSGIRFSVYSFVGDPEAKPPLEDLTTYQWDVIAVDPYGGKRWSSDSFSFTTDEPNGLSGLLRVRVLKNVTDKSGEEYARLVPRCWLKLTGLVSIETVLEDGIFDAMLPEANNYEIKVRAPGYEEKNVKDVAVVFDRETNHDVELAPTPKPTDVLKAYLCVERFSLSLKGGGKDKLQVRGLINARRPEMSTFSDDELFDFANDSLLIEIGDFGLEIPAGSIKESAPGSGRYTYKDKATGVKMKLSLYAGMNSSKGTFATSIVSTLTGKIDPAGPITVRLKNGGFDESCIFQPAQKGTKASFVLGKEGELIEPGLCISRVSISENTKLEEPLRSSRFSISGAIATGGDSHLILPRDIYLRVVENGFIGSVKGNDLIGKNGNYKFKLKREGVTSFQINSLGGTFRIRGTGADMRNADGNPVKIVLEIGDEEREVNVDMVRKGKKLVY